MCLPGKQFRSACRLHELPWQVGMGDTHFEPQQACWKRSSWIWYIWGFDCKLLEETATWEDCWPSSRQAALLIVLVRSCKPPGLPRFLQVLQVSKYFQLLVAGSITWNMFCHEAVSFQPWGGSPVRWCHAGCVFRLHLRQVHRPSWKFKLFSSDHLLWPFHTHLHWRIV